jgi:hypothetical protein
MAQFGHLLKKSSDAVNENPGYRTSPVWDELDSQHQILWSEARAKHQQRTKELAEYRRQSLSTSHRARIALLEEQLKQANNEKIRVMRQSQITAAEADYARRIQDLDIAIERAEVIANPVAYGILQVIGGTADAQ